MLKPKLIPAVAATLALTGAAYAQSARDYIQYRGFVHGLPVHHDRGRAVWQSQRQFQNAEG
ncbi:MAG: hypothetical protein JNK95_02665 [Candidatus Competibacter sp.]|nr:hypothetical protein [Candidatus Competibacter sp.]HRD49549.1 hypothetical protein [Candidatus Contendobacter sp.]